MPVMYSALEIQNPRVQHKALKLIPTIIDILDYGTIKTGLFQRLEVSFFLTISTLINFLKKKKNSFCTKNQTS